MKLRTPDEVAEQLGVPVATLKRWRYLGEGPRFVKVGRHVRYRPEDIEAYLTARTVCPGATATA